MNIWTTITPWVGQAFRDIIRSVVGPWLTAHGVLNGSNEQAGLGAIITLGGIVWGWWLTSGSEEVGHLLQKMTAQHSHADAVEVAKVLPAPPPGVVNAAVVAAVAKVLLIAFAISLFLPMGAYAQARKPAITGNPIEDIKTDLGLAPQKLITGNVEKDAHAIWDKLVSASNADLTYASQLAAAANTPAAAVRKQCYDAILKLNTQVNGMNVLGPDGKPLPQPDPKLFTGVEQAAETIDNLSPSGPLFVACAGMAQLTKTNVLTLINAIVTGAAAFAAMPVIPGL